MCVCVYNLYKLLVKRLMIFRQMKRREEMHLPWWLAPNPGCLSGRGCGGLGPHWLADRVDLRLPGGQVVHELLVLHNQLLDLVCVIRQRLLLQVR